MKTSFNMIFGLWKSRKGWVRLAHNDIRNRFRNTYLGLFWLLFQQTLMFVLVAAIWSRIFNLNFVDFAGFIGVSFAIWGFISASLNDGTHSVLLSAQLHLNTNVQPIVSIARSIYRSFIYFLLAIPIPLILIIYRNGWTEKILFIFPSFFLTTLVIFNVVCILSILIIKYRDIGQLVGVVLQIAWLVTPIIYQKEFLVRLGSEFLVDCNPFAWMVVTFRDAILGTEDFSAKYLGYLLISFVASLPIVVQMWKNDGRRYLANV